MYLQVIQLNIQESIRKQIAQELKISLSTQCQYVVTCHQCFYVNGVISIALEYMDGGSLADFLKAVRTVPEAYLAAICKQASEMSHFPNIFWLSECHSRIDPVARGPP